MLSGYIYYTSKKINLFMTMGVFHGEDSMVIGTLALLKFMFVKKVMCVYVSQMEAVQRP